MSAKTKIVVLHRKKVIYGILVAISVLLMILLLTALFLPAQTDTSRRQDPSVPPLKKRSVSESTPAVQANASAGTYIPGVYTTELVLGGQTVDVEVIVNSEAISSIRLTNPSDSLSAMYPLLAPTLETISGQIYESQSLAGITYSADNKYTSLILLEAIKNSLKKAQG